MVAKMKMKVSGAMALAVAVAILPAPAGAYQRPGATEQVTLARDGGQPDEESGQAAISADGRYVAFTSWATNLIDGLPPSGRDKRDVFVRDLRTGTTERVSVTADGGPPDAGSASPAISADGRYVAFWSGASNLVPGGVPPGSGHIFVRDRVEGVTELVSVTSDGAPGDDWSWYPSISADGRFVSFSSEALNLVPGTNAELLPQVLVRDRETGTTERVLSTEGEQVYSWDAKISGDGRFVAFLTWLGPRKEHVFVFDREARTTEQVSVASDGTPANDLSGYFSISHDGRYVAFDSQASNLVPNDTYHGHDNEAFDDQAADVFVRDRQAKTTERVSVASDGGQSNGTSDMPSISADGRFVAFHSSASNLVPGLPQGVPQVHAFVHDRLTGATEAASVGTDGTMSPGWSHAPAISDDGSVVVFEGNNGSLVPQPISETNHVFVRRRGAPLGLLGHPDVDVSQGTVEVSGRATFSGGVIGQASDPDDDGAPGSLDLSAELTGASLTYRPEREDLLLRWSVAGMPSATRVGRSADLPGGGMPGVMHGWAVEVHNPYPTRYEVRAHWASATSGGAPGAALYRCEPVDLDGIVWECTEVAELGVGYGTTGDEVRVSVPLEALEAGPGIKLSRMSAFTALGEVRAEQIPPLDEVSLPTVVLPEATVRLGLTPAGAPQESVSFDAEATLSDGSFGGVLDRSGLAPGDYRVWTRACLGGVCLATPTPVVLEAVGG